MRKLGFSAIAVDKIELIGLLFLTSALPSVAEVDVRQQEVLDIFEEICQVPGIRLMK